MPNVPEKGQLAPETDLDLNTSPALPEASVTLGMSPDSLAGTTRAALTSGFEKVADSGTLIDDESNCAADINDETKRAVPVGMSVTALVRPGVYGTRKY